MSTANTCKEEALLLATSLYRANVYARCYLHYYTISCGNYIVAYCAGLAKRYVHAQCCTRSIDPYFLVSHRDLQSLHKRRNGQYYPRRKAKNGLLKDGCNRIFDSLNKSLKIK